MKQVLWIALASAAILSPAAQASAHSVSCEAFTFLPSGGRFSYRLSGSVPEAVSAASQTSGNPAPMLSVQWLDGAGRVQTLLQAASVADYEQVAPDADYSRLPFSEPFRGQPNSGHRLYAAAGAVHGLYISLRPSSGQPQQLEVLHYLSPERYMRSTAGSCAPSPLAAPSETIARLRQLLQAQNWAEADRQTRQLLDPSSVASVPSATFQLTPDLIRTIDQAWLAASGGRFGLSVQLKLWRAAQAAHPNHPAAATEAFRNSVGWGISAPRQEQDFISSDWRNESELTYTLQAPEGHLPWAGVSDAVVQALLSEIPNGCGSCTTDAMQLRNERFYTYLPSLLAEVQAALNRSAASPQ